MDFSRADYLTGIGQEGFVAELMPKYPLYTKLLSAEAQAVIGQTHADTVPAGACSSRRAFATRGSSTSSTRAR